METPGEGLLQPQGLPPLSARFFLAGEEASSMTASDCPEQSNWARYLLWSLSLTSQSGEWAWISEAENPASAVCFLPLY